MTADLGKEQARAGDAVPRQRGDAHAAAKTSRFRRKSASVVSGALVGLILLLAGLVAGYLAAGAVQLRALTGATTVPAAALAGAVALALACIGRRRTGARPSPGRNRDPE